MGNLFFDNVRSCDEVEAVESANHDNYEIYEEKYTRWHANKRFSDPPRIERNLRFTAMDSSHPLWTFIHLNGSNEVEREVYGDLYHRIKSFDTFFYTETIHNSDGVYLPVATFNERVHDNHTLISNSNFHALIGTIKDIHDLKHPGQKELLIKIAFCKFTKFYSNTIRILYVRIFKSLGVCSKGEPQNCFSYTDDYMRALADFLEEVHEESGIYCKNTYWEMHDKLLKKYWDGDFLNFCENYLDEDVYGPEASSMNKELKHDKIFNDCSDYLFSIFQEVEPFEIYFDGNCIAHFPDEEVLFEELNKYMKIKKYI